jgi:hypothetical protein
VPAPHLRRRLAPAPSPGAATETRRTSASPLKSGTRHLGIRPGFRGTDGNQPQTPAHRRGGAITGRSAPGMLGQPPGTAPPPVGGI